MNISENLLWADLIVKRLRGIELSQSERRKLDHWLISDSLNAQTFERLNRARFDEDVLRDHQFDRYMNFEAVLERDRATRANPLQQIFSSSKTLFAAAAVLLAVGVYWVVRTANIPDNIPSPTLILASGQKVDISAEGSNRVGAATIELRNEQRIVSYRQSGASHAESGALGENRLIVPAGTDCQVELADGTLVYVGAGSELSYPVHFGADQRVVSLEGKAYFSVAKSKVPFVVKTSQVEVAVHGTEFCVEDNGLKCWTTLVSGSVSVADANGECWQLTPGQQLRYEDGKAAVCSVETLYFTAWKDGYFMFENRSLSDIVAEISDWYGYQYQIVQPSVADFPLTCRLSRRLPVEQLLEILSDVSGLPLSLQDDCIFIGR